MGAGSGAEVGFNKIIVQNLIMGLNDKFAAFGHGIPGVDAEVEKALLYLAYVPLHRHEVGGKVSLDVYRLIKRAGDQRQNPLDELIELDGRKVEPAAPGYAQHLFGKLGGADGALVNNGEGLVIGIVRFLLHHQVFRVPHDAHHDVVEVVGDSPGHRAHRLHLLGLDELLLEFQPFRDILERSLKTDDGVHPSAEG